VLFSHLFFCRQLSATGYKYRLKRDLDPEDRRYVTITLTDKGMELFNSIEYGMDEKYTTIYYCIFEDKRSQVLE